MSRFYYIFCLYVWCDVNFTFILCLLVLLRLARGHVTSEKQVVPGIPSPRQVVPLITSFYPAMF
jgi:phosphatidylserine synthase